MHSQVVLTYSERKARARCSEIAKGQTTKGGSDNATFADGLCTKFRNIPPNNSSEGSRFAGMR